MFDFLTPQNPVSVDHARLMFFGAMYVEENDILSAIDQNTEDDISKEDLKSLLIEGFSPLDMNMEEYPATDEMETMLAENWGIQSKNDLFNVLDNLLKEGDHKSLMQLISFNKTHPRMEQRTVENYRERFGEPLAFDEMPDNEFKKILAVAEQAETILPRCGVRGWDIARYVHLLRLAFLGNMINAKEAWKLLEKIKEPAQKTFSNWIEFAQSFTVGRKIWSGTASALDDACKRLIKHPKSPWNVFGWLA
jgi:hypothetical protein